jgi:hypothetical protein
MSGTGLHCDQDEDWLRSIVAMVSLLYSGGPMRACHRLTITLASLSFGLGSVSAFGEGLTITISNDTSDNIYVTAYDRNTNPPQMVLASRRIYGSASLTVSISADSSGQGHLSWTATTIDRDLNMCGHNDKPNLNDRDTVNVDADSDCDEG